MTRAEKLSKIYEVIASKELSMWCKIISKDYFEWDVPEIVVRTNWDMIETDTYWMRVRTIEKVIGHPVLIGDVLDRIGDNYWRGCTELDRDEELIRDTIIDLCFAYSFMNRNPIENQDDECIEIVYNLIKDHEKGS